MSRSGKDADDAKATNQSKKSSQHTSDDSDLKKQIDNLRILGRTWHRYHDQNRKGPANWEELLAFSQNDSAIMELRDSGVVVTGWGLRFGEISIGMSNFVLAYTPEAKKNKGPVLLMDSFVREMSAEELAESLDKQKSIGGRQKPPIFITVCAQNLQFS